MTTLTGDEMDRITTVFSISDGTELSIGTYVDDPDGCWIRIGFGETDKPEDATMLYFPPSLALAIATCISNLVEEVRDLPKLETRR